MIAASGVDGATLVLVEAPIGYGKSTFAERLLAVSDRVPVRVRATAGEAVTSLVQTLGRAFRRGGLGFVADGMTGPDPLAALDELVAALTRSGVAIDLMIDDAHLLAADAALALAEVAADLPASCRAIVCGRELSAFARLAVRAGVVWVGVDELRLDAGDIDALLDASAATVQELLAATEGWPAAVALAVDRLRREPTWSAAGSAGARALLGSLVERLVADDPRIAAIAQLPLFDDEVVGIVGGRADRRIEVPARRQGRWRVVPAAIRELLDAGPLPESTLVEVAAHYHRRGETGTALLMLRATCSAAAVRTFLAGRHWSELRELAVAELRSAIGELDPVHTDEHARLLVDAARAVELSDRPLRSRWLEEATTLAGGATLRAARAEIARDQLRSAEVEAGAALAASVLADAPADEAVTRARALVTLGMAEAFACTPETLAAAAEQFATAADLYRQAGETSLQADTLARLGYTALYMAGRPADGQLAMADALALLPVGDRVRAYWLTCYADVLDFVGRADEADAAVREALEIGEQHRDPTTSGMAWWTRSWLAAHRGRKVELHEALGQVERHRGAWLQGGQEAEYLASSAEHLALVGDVVGYHDYLQRAEAIAAEIGLPEVIAIARAGYEVEHGDAAAGLELLAGLETSRAVIPAGAPRRVLLRAVGHARLGQLDRARADLTAAHAVARSMGVPDLHHRMHRPQLAVLEAALGDALEPAPSRPRLHLLGRFSLHVGDEDRTPQPGHPATLVKLLAVRGALTTEAAIDTLWPEVDVATGRARLRNMLNRLKERSGAIVVRNGEVLTLDPAVHVDAAAFDAAATSALAATAGERVGRARHALALYTGDLLPGDVYEDWAALDRARLQRRLVSLADLVAADCIARGDLDEAARLLDLGIAAEPLDESRPLQLCALLVDQGRAGAARQVARRCVAVLAELDVEPSPQLARVAALE